MHEYLPGRDTDGENLITNASKLLRSLLPKILHLNNMTDFSGLYCIITGLSAVRNISSCLVLARKDSNDCMPLVSINHHCPRQVCSTYGPQFKRICDDRINTSVPKPIDTPKVSCGMLAGKYEETMGELLQKFLTTFDYL